MNKQLLKNNRRAFTLIEILLVIATIGIITSLAMVAYNQSRIKSRDSKRISEVISLQQALESYHQQEGVYPAGIIPGQPLVGSTSGVVYLATVPTAPTPNDGTCSAGSNAFSYQATDNGQGYAIDFCIGSKNGALNAGKACAHHNGIDSGGCCESLWRPTGSDGHLYSTVNINGKCWFNENLNVGTRIDSQTAAPCVDLNNGSNWSCQVDPNVIEKFCYQNDINYCTNYGGLYEWAEAMDLPYYCNNTSYSCDGTTCTSANYTDCTYPDPTITNRQGLCPDGWHIPSFTELQSLAQNADPGCDLSCENGGGCSCNTAGGKLKVTSTNPIPWDGTDDYGFSLIPSGFRYLTNCGFYSVDYQAFLWSSTPYLSAMETWGMDVVLYNNRAHGSYYYRADGFAIRCVKD